MTVRLLPPHARRALRKGQVAYFVLARDARSGSYITPSEDVPPVLLFRQGALSVGPFVIRKPRLRDDSVSWTQRSSLGYTTGHLYFGHSASELRGWMAIGDSEEDATIFDIVATSLPSGQYDTRMASDFGAGTVLTLGFAPSGARAGEIEAYVDDKMVSGHVGLSLDTKGRPSLTLELPAQKGEATIARINFNVGLEGDITFEGSVTRFSPGIEPATQTWTGTRLAEVVQLPGRTLAFSDAIVPDLSAALTEEEIRVEQRELSALASLVPGDDDVGKKVSAMMLENMKWAMARDADRDEVTSRSKWLTVYYGETAPSIPDTQRQDVIGEREKWYRETMATALIANAMSQQSFDSSIVPRPLTRSQKSIIGEYISKCLPAEEVFRSQQDHMWRFAAASTAPGLAKYVAEDRAIAKSGIGQSEDGRKTWAWRLLDFFTSEARMDALVKNVLSGNTGTVPVQDASKADDDAAITLREARAELENTMQELADARAAAVPDPRIVTSLERQVRTSQLLVKALEDNEKQAEDTARQRQQAAMFNMRNVCSLLKILDPTEELAKTYMITCLGQLTSVTIPGTPIDTIRKHQESMIQNIASLFDDIASGHKQAFGANNKVAEDALKNELAYLRREHAESNESIARKMTYALTQSGGATFQECSGNWAQTFKAANPKFSLTGSILARVFLAAAFTFTMVRFLQNLDGLPDTEDSTADKVKFWGTFSLMSFETLRCLLPNLKSLFMDLGGVLGSVANTAGEVVTGITVPQWMASIGQFFRSMGSAVCQAIKSVAAKVAGAATGVGSFLYELTIVKWIRSLCSLLAKGIGMMVNTVGNLALKGANLLTRTTDAIVQWMRNNETLTAIFRFVNKWAARAFTVVVSVAFVVLDTLDLIKVWKSDKSMEEKVLTSVQFGISVISVTATLLGMVIASTAWTGVGLVLGLVAVGIALLIAKIFPPETAIQKTITQVLSGFIDNVAAPKVNEMREMEQRRINALASSNV